jgi:hypothetical protein
LLWLFFGDEVLGTVCPGWPQTTFLLLSASQVARITGVSHLHPVSSPFLAATMAKTLDQGPDMPRTAPWPREVKTLQCPMQEIIISKSGHLCWNLR